MCFLKPVITVKKEIKSSGDSNMLHEDRDTTQISEKHELICLVSQTISCIS